MIFGSFIKNGATDAKARMGLADPPIHIADRVPIQTAKFASGKLHRALSQFASSRIFISIEAVE